MTTTRVLLVEDDPITLNALILKIRAQPELELVAAATRCADGRTALQENTIDVLLTDLNLPDGDGTELISELAQLQPDALAMVISVFGDERHVVRAIKAGASGYLLKDDTAQEVGEAIRALLDGMSPISPMIAHHLIHALQPRQTSVAKEESVQLSQRELEVLQLAAKGFTYSEIADFIGITTNTVSSYTRRVYRKLAVSSKNQAIYEASRMGLMSED